MCPREDSGLISSPHLAVPAEKVLVLHVSLIIQKNIVIALAGKPALAPNNGVSLLSFTMLFFTKGH